MTPAVVPCQSPSTVSASTGLRHLCPFKDEADHGAVIITWQTHGQTIELHSLAEWLDTFCEVRVSHEELTERIRREVAELDGISSVHVKTTWETAGISVICTSGSAVLR